MSMPGSPPRIARRAKGEREIFGAPSAVQVNQLLAAVTSLSAEVSVLRQRVRTLESLGERAGWLGEGAVDAHQPDTSEREQQAQWNEAFLQRVFYLAVESPPTKG